MGHTLVKHTMIEEEAHCLLRSSLWHPTLEQRNIVNSLNIPRKILRQFRRCARLFGPLHV
ncbi:uncharacterized protein G2W53_032566 [Senna tora]|uniref:Uncharacterized protein n=1 Tax=Senna tora TaxID=362788 RepID=A0A834SZ64_9FABA|nr:uncharacterized protein G2W53_032566 [Senna tora]